MSTPGTMPPTTTGVPRPAERQRGTYRVIVAALLDVGETLELTLLDTWVDVQRGRATVVAVGVPVGADEHPPPLAQLALELVGRLGDLPLEPSRFDGFDDAVE